MSTRGVSRGRMAAAAFVLFTFGSAPGFAEVRWTGPYIGFQTSFIDTFVDYENPGTPEQSLSGFMFGAAGGYDFDLGGLVVGVAGDAVFGNLNDFVRDGNYITESGKINALATLRARLGAPMGDFLPFVTGGAAFLHLEQGEICPDPAAVPFGFCRPELGHSPFDLKQTQTIIGGTVGAGLEYAFAPGWSMQGQYQFMFFPATTYVLSPDASGNPLPPSVATPRTHSVSLSVLKRY